ncbi:uncharacterized protein VTP21DRAFT_7813 [Calcarisporiella thermophila]|uniref:uncharacterized protein n=1 Tax=Calcarisporiella thermophila TaxID=911321 RepID=UPI0037448F50
MSEDRYPDQPLQKVEDRDHSVEDVSDDEAPEAVSSAAAKSHAIEAVKRKKVAVQRLHNEKKARQRNLDAKLKEQSMQSKKKKENRKEENRYTENASEDMKDLKQNTEEEKEMPTLLPTELLEEVAKREKEERKRKHLRAEEFEALLSQEEENGRSEQLKRSKQEKDVRHVGQFTVRALGKRNVVRPQPIPEQIEDFRRDHFYSRRVPRKDAVLNLSQKKGPAIKFARFSRTNT